MEKRSFETPARTLRRFRPSRTIAQLAGSARIARDRQLSSCGSSGSALDASSPSNGSLSCTAFLYGSLGQRGLGGSGLIGLAASRSIGQSLAGGTAQRAIGPFNIINAESNPVAVPEIELGQITMKVPLGAMLIDPDHAALEDLKKPSTVLVCARPRTHSSFP